MDVEGPRRRGTVRRLEVGAAGLEELLAEAASLAEQHRGWVTLVPVVPAESEPTRPLGLIASMFASARHDVPVSTWVPGAAARRGPRPDALGVQHSCGTRAAAQLGEAGLAPPAGWRVVQDHPRRGLVVEPPPGTDRREMFRWLLAAGEQLSRVPFAGRWSAEVHRPA